MQYKTSRRIVKGLVQLFYLSDIEMLFFFLSKFCRNIPSTQIFSYFTSVWEIEETPFKLECSTLFLNVIPNHQVAKIGTFQCQSYSINTKVRPSICLSARFRETRSSRPLFKLSSLFPTKYLSYWIVQHKGKLLLNSNLIAQPLSENPDTFCMEISCTSSIS